MKMLKSNKMIRRIAALEQRLENETERQELKMVRQELEVLKVIYHRGPTFKKEHIRKLLMAYSILMSLNGSPPPDIFFSRKQFNKRLKQFEVKPHFGVKELDSPNYLLHGCCSHEAKAIFVSVRIREIKRGERVVKARFSDRLNTLAHELVHWYFPDMEHGLEFEKRVKGMTSFVVRYWRRQGHMGEINDIFG